MYELLLTSVVIAGAYWGQFFLRKRPHGTATFGYMQLASGGLALCGVWANHGGPAAGGVLGAIGLGMGTCLLLVGPAVRGLARRFAMAERYGIARRLLDLAEMLNPGAGIAEEKQLLGAMTEIRDGKIDQTITALSAARARESGEATRAIDERIAMLYLAAYRWEDAIAFAEDNLITKPRAASAAAGASASADDDDDDDLPSTDPRSPSLRDALGLAPPVWIELMGAYGRVGNYDRAARMLGRLEAACADRADSGVWVHRARMMFLALAGRPAAVAALVAPDKSRHMSDAARSYWVAVAHEHTGDRAAASAAYAKARSRSRGKPRELIDRAVAALATARRAELSPLAAETAAKAEAAPIPKTPAVARPPAPWAAPVLTGAILAVAATIFFAVGSGPDIGTLVRAGALVRGLVDGGEWWRLVSCVFVHVGAIHLCVNAIGLYFVGKLAEDIFGGSRTVAIFAVAGIVGSVASYLGSPADISAGASGGIFGILGAVLAELTVRRSQYRQAWKRGVWGSLAVVTVAQIGVDFMYPIVDQWAHGAGLLAGALAGVVLSPRARYARLSLYAARSLAIVFALASGFAAVMIARTSVADSLDNAPHVTRAIAGGALHVQVPATWQVEPTGVGDAAGVIEIDIGKTAIPAGATPAQMIAAWIAGEPARAHAKQFDASEAVKGARAIPLPAGWEGAELVASLTDAMDYEQRSRVVTCGRAFGGEVVLVSVYVPDSLAGDLRDIVARVIASIGPT